MSERGLFEKYRAEKAGEPIDECFILEPGNDPAARDARRTYAEETDDVTLAIDLIDWMDTLEMEAQNVE